MKKVGTLLLFIMTICLSKIDADHRFFLKDIIPKQSVGAEIGVWKGDFSSFLLTELQPKKLHLIDPWKFMPQRPSTWQGGGIAKSQDDMDNIYKLVCSKFDASSQVIIHRMTASETSKLFENSYFDWIYIDGDHSYEAVMADLNNYFPKVKEGGLIIGDDWQAPSVRQAVIDFCKSRTSKGCKLYGNQYVITK